MSIIDKLASFLEKEKYFLFQQKHGLYSAKWRKEQVYVYMKNGKCLYIGKAKLLYNRIKSHYIESFSPVSGDTKDMSWHRFFSQHQGEVTIYWNEFQSEEERQLVEILLTKLLQPIFLKYK